MEKFPEADQLIQPLDIGTYNSYLGHRGEPTTGDIHNLVPSALDQGSFRTLAKSTLWRDGCRRLRCDIRSVLWQTRGP